MSLRLRWRVGGYLAALLVMATLVNMLVVGSAVLLFGIPRIEAESQQLARQQAVAVTQREELMLGALEGRMQLLAAALQRVPEVAAPELLDQAVAHGQGFRAIYVVSPAGAVLAAGVTAQLAARRTDLLGSDLSASRLFREAQQRRQVTWGDKYLSSLSGDVTAGLAYPLAAGRMLIAEVPLRHLLSSLPAAAAQLDPGSSALIWLVDRHGEVLADNTGGGDVGAINLLGQPMLQAASDTSPQARPFQFSGRNYHVAVARSAALDWFVVARVPAGLDNGRVRTMLGYVVGGFLGSLLLGLALAPFWASGLVRALRAIAARAQLVASGSPDAGWPQGAIVEFNELSASLASMSGTLSQRERELRELNLGLEQRVAQRTQALEQANAETSSTLSKLQRTRDELVRAEKMAALGGLVAGVAHELNTPLGNALMAVSTLAHHAGKFRAGMQSGLRRAALDDLLGSVEQAGEISMRNLERAAELVNSFKQVAVDQTSAQRRRFDLHEVVDELLMTIKPSLSRTPFEVRVDVPLGISMDSFPGALGQCLANLVNNAVLHGLDGRERGRIRIWAERGELDEVAIVRLHVEDDGCGIPASLLARIFDPFVTTRMGRGGTGLGLHIAYNAVNHVLGGAVTVHSVVGEGTHFTLQLPLVAPVTGTAH